MAISLKDELIACLKLFDNDDQRKKLAPIIAELQKAQKTIEDDKNLDFLLHQLLVEEAPELVKDPKCEPLINFCLSLKYRQPSRPYRAR